MKVANVFLHIFYIISLRILILWCSAQQQMSEQNVFNHATLKTIKITTGCFVFDGSSDDTKIN